MSIDVQQERNKIDGQFRADVAAAAEKRDKALAKLPNEPGKGANIAELAWNQTKEAADPSYGDCAIEHRNKLDAAVGAIKATGNADIAGLEKFEARVVELLDAEKEVATIPAKVTTEAKK